MLSLESESAHLADRNCFVSSVSCFTGLLAPSHAAAAFAAQVENLFHRSSSRRPRPGLVARSSV
eukprot:1086250-Rhodomonas_salina.1